MRVLITGANGQLGRELTEVFSADAHHEVLACNRSTLDVGNRDSTLGVITSNSPDVIVHAAAYTAVDDAETDIDGAYLINAIGTRNVVEGARIAGSRVIYVSTDYVFDGTATTPYKEWDTTNPQSIYGMSKRAGELELRPEDTVVRTSWVFGRYGNNIVKTLLKLAATDKELTFVDDQLGKPTNAADLAAAIKGLAIARAAGMFHVTNDEQTSWFDFAQTIFSLAGADPSRISPVSSADLEPKRPAPRPQYSVLDNSALRYLGMPALVDHHDAAARVVKELMQ